jgi:hypothetical protein
MIKKSILFLLILAFTLCVGEASAVGPFDQVCPNCQGTGKVTTTSTCPTCHGSGKITVWETCARCGGDGKVTPSVILKSMNGYGTLVGLDWVARVEGVFHNEEDVGTYGVARSEVRTVTTTYYHASPRTYFPPHQDVKITIDTPEIAFGEDWVYTIYLYSVDEITCPDCGGSGGKSVLVTCTECNGAGTVTTSVTCTVCNGSGYVTNWTNITIVAIVIVGVLIAGSSALIIRIRRSRKQ